MPRRMRDSQLDKYPLPVQEVAEQPTEQQKNGTPYSKSCHKGKYYQPNHPNHLIDTI
jgi:hypothetical protein